MIRTLGVIAASAALVSAVCFGAAIVITGPEAFAQGIWLKKSYGWVWKDRSGPRWNGPSIDVGPAATREIPWTGGSSLTIALPADVRYVQSAGPPGVRVTAPPSVVDDVVLRDGRLSLQGYHLHLGDIAVVVTAPAVTAFVLDGSGNLSIENYQQDHVSVSIAGSGDVKARGVARDGEVTIEGSGDADVGDLRLASARVRVDGSGSVRVAPTAAADVDISGSGDVDLLSDPPKLQTNISGSGDVRRHAKG